jgi:hypothetical protein
VYYGQAWIFLKLINICSMIFCWLLVFTSWIPFTAKVATGYMCSGVVIYVAFFLWSIGFWSLLFLAYVALCTPGNYHHHHYYYNYSLTHSLTHTHRYYVSVTTTFLENICYLICSREWIRSFQSVLKDNHPLSSYRQGSLYSLLLPLWASPCAWIVCIEHDMMA